MVLIKQFFIGDNLLVILPHKIFLLESLKKGLIPLWNPHMWAGFPEIGDISISLFNPFNFLYLILPNMTGLTMSIALAIAIGFVGTYVFMRQENLSKLSSLAGAIIFSFSGSMMNMTADAARIESMCFLPWILLAISKKKFVLTVVLLALDFLVGRTQQYYMIIIFTLAYCFFHHKFNHRIRKLAVMSLAILFSFGLAAFILLPQLELLQLSSRANANQIYNTIWSLHPAGLINFFLVDFWGRHNEGSFWGPNVTSTIGYLGFFSLTLILFNLRKFEKKYFWLFGAAIFCVIASLGKYNFVYHFFLLIPGFSYFRNPSSWLIIYSFALAWLLSILFNTKNLLTLSLRKTYFIIGLILIFFGIGGILIFHYFPGYPHRLFITFGNIIHKNPSAFHNIEVDRQIMFLISRNMLILGILGLFWTIIYNRKTLLIILFLDLLFLGQGDVILTRVATNIFTQAQKSTHIEFLSKNISIYRFVSTSEFLPVRGMSIYMTDYSRRPPFLANQFWSLNNQEIATHEIYQKQIQLLPPNLNLAYNLSSINSYSGFYLKYFGDYFKNPSQDLSASAKRVMKLRNENKDPLDPSHVNFNYINLNDERLAKLSVKYILANEKLNLMGYKEIIFNNGFFLYENPQVLERAQIFDKKNQIKYLPKINDINANVVQLSFDKYLPASGDYILLRDTYYPGWIATDQNQNALTIEKKDIFRKIKLKTDTKKITFTYHPESFFTGLQISAVTLLILFVSVLFQKKKNKKKPSKDI